MSQVEIANLSITDKKHGSFKLAPILMKKGRLPII
jgi:hypothetical protein